MERLSWIMRVGLECDPYKRERFDYLRIREDNVTMEPEIRDAVTRGKGQILPPWPLEEHWPTDTDLGFQACRDVREYACVALSHQVSGNLFQQPQASLKHVPTFHSTIRAQESPVFYIFLQYLVL